MTTETIAFSTFTLKVDGQSLPNGVLDKITAVRVEQSLYLPAQCAVTIHDVGAGETPDDKLVFNITDGAHLPIGHDIEVAMGHEDQRAQTIFKGEIVAHDIDIAMGGLPYLTVRCYDRMHRLQRGRYTKSYTNMTDSDIAQAIAGEAGLSASADSATEVYSYVLQNNQTDYEFLRERANRIGYELYVDDRTLHFRKPGATASATVSVTLWQDVLRLHMYQTSVGQITEVGAHGWDYKRKQGITGTATSGSAAKSGQGGGLKSGTQLTSAFSMTPKMRLSRHIVQSQSEATTLAKSGADDLTEGAISLEAEVIGRADLKPGIVVSLKEAGQRFSGDYYVTSAAHCWTAGRGEYLTTIRVGGRREGTLLELAGANGRRHNGSGHGVSGAPVIGIVTNNKDDEGMGRVKVKLPWLPQDANGQDIETDWARIISPGGGNNRGIYFLPEVNDEVLVAFEHGDPRRPYVIGGLWNGTDAAPKKNDEIVDGAGVSQRIIKSRSGHIITIDDSDENNSIKIVDSSGNNTFTIDTKNKKIVLSAEQDLELKAGQNVTITAGQNVSVSADQNCDIKATNNATLKGLATSVQGDTTCEVKGNTSAKLGGAQVSVEAEATCAVKGAMVMIN